MKWNAFLLGNCTVFMLVKLFTSGVNKALNNVNVINGDNKEVVAPCEKYKNIKGNLTLYSYFNLNRKKRFNFSH